MNILARALISRPPPLYGARERLDEWAVVVIVISDIRYYRMHACTQKG